MPAKRRSSSSSGAPLACPRCARHYPLTERFCDHCGMPLVYHGAPVVEAPTSDAHGRARKVRPEYARGPLVRVAGGRNQAEAELIQNLLLEEGVPSMLRRTAGFDVPDFLAAGPRDVLVPESGAATARTALLDAELIEDADSSARVPSARQAVVVTIAITAAAGIVATLLWLVLGGA